MERPPPTVLKHRCRDSLRRDTIEEYLLLKLERGQKVWVSFRRGWESSRGNPELTEMNFASHSLRSEALTRCLRSWLSEESGRGSARWWSQNWTCFLFPSIPPPTFRRAQTFPFGRELSLWTELASLEPEEWVKSIQTLKKKNKARRVAHFPYIFLSRRAQRFFKPACTC